jgi:hypothetical protein
VHLAATRGIEGSAIEHKSVAAVALQGFENTRVEVVEK